MSRLFTKKIFDQYVNGTDEVVTSSDLRELLGRADILVFEVYVGQAGGTSPTLTVKVQHSGSGQRYLAHSTVVSGAPLTTLPFQDASSAGSEAAPLLGLVQLAISLGGTTPSAYVQIWATGRTF